MSLSRAQVKEILSTAGVSDAGKMETAIAALINGHTATVDVLKEERDNYKKAADELPGVKKELEDLKTKYDSDSPYKEKYEKVKKEYDDFKTDQTAKETKAKKTAAYKQLLKDAGVADKHIETVLKVSPIDSIEFTDDGKVKDSNTKIDGIKKEWADFIVQSGSKGADTSTPPGSNGGTHGSGIGAQIAKEFMASHYGVQDNSQQKKE